MSARCVGHHSVLAWMEGTRMIPPYKECLERVYQSIETATKKKCSQREREVNIGHALQGLAFVRRRVSIGERIDAPPYVTIIIW